MSIAHTAFRDGKSSCVTGIFLHNPPAGMTEKPIQLGLAGLGTVGSGVYETLCRNHALLEARSKIPFRLKRIAVRNLEKPRETVVPRELLTDDWQDLVNDPEIDIIIELIGGTRQAYDLVTLALRAGKPVVTGNKALLAEYGAEIFKLSAEMGTPIYFEASAGGGIPIIQSLQNSLICNHINSIVGIINGTSNYILSAMGEHGAITRTPWPRPRSWASRKRPLLDVNGWDAAHKALILAMLAYGTTISPDKFTSEALRISPAGISSSPKNWAIPSSSLSSSGTMRGRMTPWNCASSPVLSMTGISWLP